MIKAALAKEIAIRVQDQVGVLAQVLSPIAEANLNLKAINTVSLANEAQVRLIAENTDKVEEVLKSSGYTPWVREVVAVEIANEAGAVAQVAAKLAEAKIDIKASWASVADGVNATFYLATADNRNALKVLVA